MKVHSSVDFSKLPGNILVVVEKSRYGHLTGRPKSDRYNHLIEATTVDGDCTLYIQEDYNVDDFITGNPENPASLDRG